METNKLKELKRDCVGKGAAMRKRYLDLANDLAYSDETIRAIFTAPTEAKIQQILYTARKRGF